MSNNTNRKNKLTGKKMGILAAAALTATLIGGNVPVITEPVSAAEAQESEAVSVIPDNITIDQPTELANIGLPATEYGTYEWADGSFVPTERVQACEVFLIPAEGQDLSNVDGWDPESGTVTGYINVIVNSAADNKTEETEAPSETPKVTETPSETPAVDEKDSKTDKDNTENENKDADKSEKDSDEKDASAKLEPADGADQDADSADDENNTDSDDTDNNGDDNIFDNPVLPDQTDDRPTDAQDNLSDAEKEERAEINHTCDGITVNGTNLPWYVQFRVSSGDSYQFTNESDAMIFQSYEFELWDLQKDTEYEIPSGEYISVTVPVKAGYQYTIEHLLDNGATETIIPSVDNDIMVFSTHSFSPFGIAGSRQLVGPDGGENSDSTDTVTPTPTSVQGQSANTNSNTVSMNNDSDNNSSSTSAQSDATSNDDTVKDNGAVNTGDTTTILPFVALVVVAAVIIGAVVFVKKKKK